MNNGKYKPPFPWFGGKSSVADVVWQGLGDVRNYVEPFFGSGAVLFLRPGGAGHTETVNDSDAFVSNFWRSMKADVDAVAEAADWPVNEADLHARHLWLLGQRERLTERLMGDPEFYDAKSAGWWVWGQCCWIGGGWCSGEGPWVSENGFMVKREGHGQGVNRKRPQLGHGKGVKRQLRESLRDYLAWFAARLERVSVCCGDWQRVCGESVTTLHGLTGVFLDPPYADTAGRDAGCYAVDSLSVAHDVREWAIANGDNPELRIVLAGYDGEHVMPDSWRVHAWKTQGGMANQALGTSRGKANRGKERLWFSPHCAPAETDRTKQLELMTA